MRIFLGMQLIVLATLLLYVGSRSQSVVSRTTLIGTIDLDVRENFDFNSLLILIQHRQSDDQAWETLELRKPDPDGRFEINAPSGSRISLQVSTSDPTILSAGEDGRRVEFYSIANDGRKTIYWEEFLLDSSNLEQVKRVSLSRGAALNLCEVKTFNAGYVQLIKNEKTRTKSLVLTFESTDVLKKKHIGGIEPGNWTVSYHNNEGRPKRTLEFRLKPGETGVYTCENL